MFNSSYALEYLLRRSGFLSKDTAVHMDQLLRSCTQMACVTLHDGEDDERGSLRIISPMQLMIPIADA
jgi:hypothetical protein